jgi:transitional endoplasmic reticulum ATPase
MAIDNAQPVPLPEAPKKEISLQRAKRTQKPKRDPELEIPKTKFEDVIGLERVKEKLREKVLSALDQPELFESYKQKPGTGIILYGPPGVGKTLIIKALGGEAGRPVIIAKINEIVDAYTGNTEKNMHKIFEKARKAAPAIVFFDEIDALGTKRSGLGGEGTAQVMKMAVEQFLMEMDGIDTNRDNLFVFGATNQPWDIDPALKRAGRFETSIWFAPPKRKEREELFKYYLRSKPLDRKISYGRLARATMGFSQADIKRVCNDATDKARMRTMEIGTGVLHSISTSDILKVLKDKESGKNSLDPWFSLVTKNFKLRKDRKNKNVVTMTDDLTMEDRIMYKDLFSYVSQRWKNRGRVKFIRWVSLYLM